MKKARKALLTLCAALLLVSMTAGVTIAYLTSEATVTNTFTVGKVVIDLDEAKVKLDGTYETTHDSRVKENTYKLMPGHTYYKDPTVTVKAESESCYVRMIVTVDGYSKLVEAFPKDEAANAQYWNGDIFLLQNVVTDWSNDVWAFEEFDAATSAYEFRYVGSKATDGVIPAVDKDLTLEDLFTALTLPGTVDEDELPKLAGLKIGVTAEAIQADSFKSADEAWQAFEGQN